MKKILVSIAALFVLSDLSGTTQSVKLCIRQGCPYYSQMFNWGDASGSIGGTITFGNTSGANWSLTISGLTISGTSRCDSSQRCYCRVTGVDYDSICSGSELYVLDSSIYGYVCSSGPEGVMCPRYCAECAQMRTVAFGGRSCNRGTLFAVPTNVSPVYSVTCPLSGTCTNSNYRTVATTSSCPSGFIETTSPTLTITGTYSDEKGTFTYGSCNS